MKTAPRISRNALGWKREWENETLTNPPAHCLSVLSVPPSSLERPSPVRLSFGSAGGDTDQRFGGRTGRGRGWEEEHGRSGTRGQIRGCGVTAGIRRMKWGGVALAGKIVQKTCRQRSALTIQLGFTYQESSRSHRSLSGPSPRVTRRRLLSPVRPALPPCRQPTLPRQPHECRVPRGSRCALGVRLPPPRLTTPPAPLPAGSLRAPPPTRDSRGRQFPSAGARREPGGRDKGGKISMLSSSRSEPRRSLN